MFWDGERWIDERTQPTRPVPKTPTRHTRRPRLPIPTSLRAVAIAVLVTAQVGANVLDRDLGSDALDAAAGPKMSVRGEPAAGHGLTLYGQNLPANAVYQLGWDRSER